MGAASTSKKSNAGKNVLVFFIVFIILEMLIIFGIGKVFKNENVTPSVMGYSLFMTKEDLVQNGPNGTVVAVPKNVLVIASDGLPDPTNKIGCAILCEDIEGVGTGVYWLADITSREGQDGVDYTVTNGTQGYVIKSQNIVGVCASYFVTAGKVIGFVTQKFGMICCAVVPLFLLVLIELIIAIATHSSDDDDDDDDDDDEGGEKSVELDDFLFGGQSDGEQIAKSRKRAKAAMEEYDEDDEDDDEDEDDDVDFRPARPAKKPVVVEEDEPVQKPAIEEPEVKKAPVKETPAAAAETAAPADEGSLSLKDDEIKDTYYEKASRLVDGEAAPERPARRPARRQGRGSSSARRRRPVSAASTGDASLEDLMKLMEAEQNKLRDKMDN